MNRIHNFKKISRLAYNEECRKVAVHEAGHAAAIHFGNKQKKLPPVFFQIAIQRVNGDFQTTECLGKHYDPPVARIEGGRLIHTLPLSFGELAKKFSGSDMLAYEKAFEADMVNLLVGPLAEAKYISSRDEEPMGPRSVNVYSLHYYGGLSDLNIVNEYLDCFTTNDEQRQNKLNQLFLAAFNFISEIPHWLAITTLADYILANDKNIIECEEVIAVLEAGSRTTRYIYC